MDTLPKELLFIIFSDLNLKDRAKCRRVCIHLKNAIDSNLESITHIAFTPRFSDHFLYIYRKYVNAKFVKVSDRNIGFPSNLASFLASKCPNLQVLIGSLGMNLVDLHKFSKSLKFFACSHLDVPNTVQTKQLFNQFEQLETFYSKHENTGLDLLKEVLHWKSNFFTHFSNPSNELLQQIADTIGPEKVRSIEYNRRSDFCYSIPRSIAASLLCLTIQRFDLSNVGDLFEKPVFEGPLLNLIAIKAEIRIFTQTDYENLLVSRKFQNITFKLDHLLPVIQLRNFLASLNSYDQLERMIFYIERPIEEPEVISFEVSLPPRIQLFELFLPEKSYEIVDASSSTLTELRVCNLLTFEWNFPKLTQLFIKFDSLKYKLNEDDAKKLFLSLSKCTRMEIIEVSFDVLQENFVFQSIINSFGTMKHLKLVDFKPTDPLEPFSFGSVPDKPKCEPVVKIDQSKLPSVTSFQFHFPVNVQLHTLDSLEKRSIHYKDDDDVEFVINGDKYYYFEYGQYVNSNCA